MNGGGGDLWGLLGQRVNFVSPHTKETKSRSCVGDNYKSPQVNRLLHCLLLVLIHLLGEYIYSWTTKEMRTDKSQNNKSRE